MTQSISLAVPIFVRADHLMRRAAQAMPEVAGERIAQ